MTIDEAINLIERVCIRQNIKYDNLKSKSRERNNVMQRRAFMYLLKNHDMTSSEIGKVFNRDHATVLANHTKHDQDIEIGYKDYKKIFGNIKREFIFKMHTVDNTIQTLMEIITAENALRHDDLIDEKKRNVKLKKTIEKLKKEKQYLKDQLNILNK